MSSNCFKVDIQYVNSLRSKQDVNCGRYKCNTTVLTCICCIIHSIVAIKKQVTQLTSYSVLSAKQVNMHMPSGAMKLV